MTSQEYQEAIDWLFVQMPNYQIDGQKAYKPGLDNIKKLCDFFGNPQDKIKTIHIGGAGTEKVLQAICWLRFYKNQATKPDFTIRRI